MDHRSGALERRALARLHGLLDVPHGLSRARGIARVRCGRPEASSVNASIPVASIDVTNDRLMSRLMDADLLGGQDHPTITFRSTRVEALGPAHR
jgi:polyisoprenoid-binding protein YceI